MQEKENMFLIFDNLIQKHRISHAFLVEVDEEYNTSFAKEMVKQMLKSTFDSDSFVKVCNLIDSDNYPELKIIKPEGKMIKKEQLIQVMNELKNKPIYSNKNFYVIEFAENLNSSSANTILKFLEEPEDGIVAILITKNVYNVLPTISSRCQVLSFNKYEKKEYDEHFIKCAVDFIIKVKKYKKGSIAYLSELYSLKTEELIEIFNICIIIYSDILKYLKTNKKSDFILKSDELSEYLDEFKVLEVIEIENKIIEVLNLIKYNINSRMILDKFIIDN